MKNYTIIIFGGTGDLAKRKLFPAIKSLAMNSKDENFTVVGIGRKQYSDEEYVMTVFPDKDVPENLNIKYYITNIEKSNSLKEFRKTLESVEPEKTEGRIFYLATGHTLFGNIAKSISSCCADCQKGFTRIVVEKPFGEDLKSSRKLNNLLRKYFSEEQIYRADHYLAKETVDNILRLRLSNPLFESVWNSNSVKIIKMEVNEELGVGNRLSYYDNAGAIKDMIQNHLLQTISFVLMDPPISLSNVDFKKAKVDAIKKLEFRNELVKGQYKGYREEAKEINPDSNTETFVELRLYSKSKRWKGTEIILRTGKMLEKREAFIEMEFKKEPCLLYCNIGSAPNKLVLHIQPLDNVELEMNTTLPGEKTSSVPVKMTFCKSCEFSANSPEGYEVIFKECLAGNKRIFIGDEELDASWKLTDKIIGFSKGILPVIYNPKSKGPEFK